MSNNSLSEFIKSASGTAIIITLCVVIIALAVAFLIRTIAKHGKALNIIVPGKRNLKTDSTGKIDVGQLKDEYFAHKFFTSIKYEYINTAYGFEYPIYDALIEHGLRSEDPLMIEFKKTIANKFLAECLFKYLEEATSNWILSVLKEYSESKKAINPNYIPPSLCNIIESVMLFTKPTSLTATALSFEFKNKTIDGIPSEFVERFCNVINKDITFIQRLFSSIIYSTPHQWYDKISEILDTYELILSYLKNAVDSTLIVMNGQMKHYLDDLFPNGVIEESIKVNSSDTVDNNKPVSSSSLGDYLKG